MKTKKEQEDKAIDWVHNYGDFMLKQGVKEGKSQAISEFKEKLKERNEEAWKEYEKKCREIDNEPETKCPTCGK